MQRFKSLSALRRSFQRQSHSCYSTISAQRDNYPQHHRFEEDVSLSLSCYFNFLILILTYTCISAMIFFVQLQVLVEGRAFSRAAILNRPSQLNAITTSMVSSSFSFLIIPSKQKFRIIE